MKCSFVTKKGKHCKKYGIDRRSNTISCSVHKPKYILTLASQQYYPTCEDILIKSLKRVGCSLKSVKKQHVSGYNSILNFYLSNLNNFDKIQCIVLSYGEWYFSGLYNLKTGNYM